MELMATTAAIVDSGLELPVSCVATCVLCMVPEPIDIKAGLFIYGVEKTSGLATRRWLNVLPSEETVRVGHSETHPVRGLMSSIKHSGSNNNNNKGYNSLYSGHRCFGDW